MSAEFEKLNADPKDDRGTVKDFSGKQITGADGKPIVVSYQEYRDCVSDPGRMTRLASSAAKKTIVSLPADPPSDEGGEAAPPPVKRTASRSRAKAAK